MLFLEFHLSFDGAWFRRSGTFDRLLGFRLALLAREIGATLHQHVTVTAGIFGPVAVPFRGNHAADQPVEEIAIMADAVSYTHLRAHETVLDLVCRLLL